MLCSNHSRTKGKRCGKVLGHPGKCFFRISCICGKNYCLGTPMRIQAGVHRNFDKFNKTELLIGGSIVTVLSLKPEGNS